MTIFKDSCHSPNTKIDSNKVSPEKKPKSDDDYEDDEEQDRPNYTKVKPLIKRRALHSYDHTYDITLNPEYAPIIACFNDAEYIPPQEGEPGFENFKKRTEKYLKDNVYHKWTLHKLLDYFTEEKMDIPNIIKIITSETIFCVLNIK